jgi:large subunit ribosomal protein L7/L12
MTDLKKLTEDLSNLTIINAVELIKMLEKKWNIKSYQNISNNKDLKEEKTQTPQKTEFNVELSSIGPKKIQIIKAVKELTGLGLREAKDLVDNAPKIIKSNIPKEEAGEIKNKLEKQGAEIKIL